MQKNFEESARVANHRKVRAKAKSCFHNAFQVIQHLPGYQWATYVEGIAVFNNGLLIEHAWIEANGEVIDPTVPDEEMAYFAGLCYNGQAGISEALRLPKFSKDDPDLPIFFRFGWSGCNSEALCQAWDDAYSYLISRGKMQETGRPPSRVKQLLERCSVN